MSPRRGVGLRSSLRSGTHVGRPMTPLGYRIPSSRMPGSTFEQPHQRERRADHEPSHAQRFDRVFAAGGNESARRHPGRRHVRAVELDTEDQCPCRRRTDGVSARIRGGHAGFPASAWTPALSAGTLQDGSSPVGDASRRSPSLVRPDRSCLSSSRESAVAEPGRARSTRSVFSGTRSTRPAQI